MNKELGASMSLLLLLVFSSDGLGALPPCSEGTAYRTCQACGTAKSAEGRTLDVQKNRGQEATKPTKITVAEVRDPKNDNGHFNPNMQVEVTGYVAFVTEGGFEETSNCGRADLRDIHINIVTGPQEVGNQTKYVVVEFTPRWEKTFGLDDSDYQKMLGGVKSQIELKWVTFRGWMLYDYIHADASESVHPGKPGNWRATPWEVHPVTSFKILSGPPASSSK
jgi:hypothetical protein